MKIQEWRKINRYSQRLLADSLERFAREKYPKVKKKLPQRTFAYWETGGMPKKFWRDIIKDFTAGSVTTDDWEGNGA